MSNLDAVQWEARAHVDEIHARAKRSANASVARYYAGKAAEQHQRDLKAIERHAPAWAAARAQWALEAEARDVIQRVAFGGQPPTKDEKAAIDRYLATQEQKGDE
ncbi:MAG: hypothetical protein ACHQ01_09605 [Candidatus Limnocylindrales bacterium]